MYWRKCVFPRYSRNPVKTAFVVRWNAEHNRMGSFVSFNAKAQFCLLYLSLFVQTPLRTTPGNSGAALLTVAMQCSTPLIGYGVEHTAAARYSKPYHLYDRSTMSGFRSFLSHLQLHSAMMPGFGMTPVDSVRQNAGMPPYGYPLPQSPYYQYMGTQQSERESLSTTVIVIIVFSSLIIAAAFIACVVCILWRRNIDDDVIERRRKKHAPGLKGGSKQRWREWRTRWQYPGWVQ